MTGDGKADLLLVGPTTAALYSFDGSIVSFGDGTANLGAAIANVLDGDTAQVIIASPVVGQLRFWSAPYATPAILSVDSPRNPVTGDFNGDGKTDLAVQSHNDLTWWLGTDATMVDAGPDQSIASNQYGTAQVTLAGTVSGFSQGGVQWFEGAQSIASTNSVTLSVPIGVHTYTFVANNIFGPVSDSVTVGVSLPGRMTNGSDGRTRCHWCDGCDGRRVQQVQWVRWDQRVQQVHRVRRVLGAQGATGATGAGATGATGANRRLRRGPISGALLLLTGDDQPPAGYTLFATFETQMDTTPNGKGGNKKVTVRVYRKN